MDWIPDLVAHFRRHVEVGDADGGDHARAEADGGGGNDDAEEVGEDGVGPRGGQRGVRGAGEDDAGVGGGGLWWGCGCFGVDAVSLGVSFGLCLSDLYLRRTKQLATSTPIARRGSTRAARSRAWKRRPRRGPPARLKPCVCGCDWVWVRAIEVKFGAADGIDV